MGSKTMFMIKWTVITIVALLVITFVEWVISVEADGPSVSSYPGQVQQNPYPVYLPMQVCGWGGNCPKPEIPIPVEPTPTPTPAPPPLNEYCSVEDEVCCRMVIGSATGECCDISGTKIPEFTCVNPLPFPPQPDPPLHHNIIAGAYNVWYFMGRPYDENGMLVPQGYITFNVVNPDTGVIHDIACGQIGNIQKLQCLDLGPE